MTSDSAAVVSYSEPHPVRCTATARSLSPHSPPRVRISGMSTGPTWPLPAPPAGRQLPWHKFKPAPETEGGTWATWAQDWCLGPLVLGQPSPRGTLWSSCTLENKCPGRSQSCPWPLSWASWQSPRGSGRALAGMQRGQLARARHAPFCRSKPYLKQTSSWASWPCVASLTIKMSCPTSASSPKAGNIVSLSPKLSPSPRLLQKRKNTSARRMGACKRSSLKTVGSP